MGKMKDFRCNVCEKGFDTEQFLINHFHTEHPDDGLTLWDSIGRTGYAFADSIANKMRDVIRTECERNDALRKSEADYRTRFAKTEARLQAALLDLELIRRVLEFRWIDWKEFPSVPPTKRGTYLTWQPGSEKPFMDERYSVLHWTGTRFYSSFPVSHWAELEPPSTPDAKEVVVK